MNARKEYSLWLRLSGAVIIFATLAMVMTGQWLAETMSGGSTWWIK